MKGTATGLFVISVSALIVSLVLIGMVTTKRSAILEVKNAVEHNEVLISNNEKLIKAVQELVKETKEEHEVRLAAQLKIVEATEKTA